MEIIQQETEDIDISQPVSGDKFLKGAIDFKNVRFAYPSRKEIQIWKT